MFLAIAGFFAVAGPVLVSPAVADDADTCHRGKGDEKIAACTRVI
jgi:hypothetical protein